MIHYTLNQDASIDYGCWNSFTDLTSSGLIIPMFKSGEAPFSSVLPHDERSWYDGISHFGHNRLGDSTVINRQAEVVVEPLIIEDKLCYINSSWEFDGTTADYLGACRAYFGTLKAFDMKGDCYYDTSKDVAFVPIQSVFGNHTYQIVKSLSYDVAYHSAKVFSWVPMGKHYAIVTTEYRTQTYLRKYQNSSSARVEVSITYCDIFGDGSIKTHTIPKLTVLNVSGDVPQHHAVVALCQDLHPDPTRYGANTVKALVPITGIPASLQFHYSRRFDPRASLAYNIDAVRSRVAKVGLRLSDNTLSSLPSYDDWADLADSAIDNCKFVDINAYAFARDLKSTGSELKSILRVIASPTNPKSWASLYLNTRYGTRLTVSDTRELMDGLKRSAKNMRSTWSKDYSVVRSFRTLSPPDFKGVTSSTRLLCYKVYYKPNDSAFKKSLKRLWDWDMYPSLQNLWDLVPYSFCVDWIGNIESTLETIDRRQYEELIHVLGCTYSIKDEYYFPLTLSDLGFQDATVVITTYHRYTKPSLHQSSLRLTTGHPSTINVVDGISLILQRMK